MSDAVSPKERWGQTPRGRAGDRLAKLLAEAGYPEPDVAASKALDGLPADAEEENLFRIGLARLKKARKL